MARFCFLGCTLIVSRPVGIGAECSQPAEKVTGTITRAVAAIRSKSHTWKFLLVERC